MLFQDWQTERALLNHDILCNKVRNELASMRIDPTGVTPARLTVWAGLKARYREFLCAAVEGLKPSQVLIQAPFDKWTEQQRRTYGAVFDALFLAITRLEDKISDLEELLDTSVLAVESFLEVPHERRTTEQVKELQLLLDQLSHGISSLPNHIEG